MRTGLAVLALLPLLPAAQSGDGTLPLERIVRDGCEQYLLPLTPTLKIAFVRIPPGRFVMGSPSDEPYREPDETRHTVTITKEFFLQTTEMTQEAWEAVMGDNPSRFRGDPKLPVERVSWDAVQTFLAKVNERFRLLLPGRKLRLPSEAEWEYASRAGNPGTWGFGNLWTQLYDFAWFGENSEGRTHPVAQKKPNEWGLFDMHGNVWEYVQDGYGPLGEAPQADPVAPENKDRPVVRGGSWVSFPGMTRSAKRHWFRYADSGGLIGFRLVLP